MKLMLQISAKGVEHETWLGGEGNQQGIVEVPVV